MLIRKEREEKEAKYECGLGSSREDNSGEGIKNDPGERNDNSGGWRHLNKDLRRRGSEA